MTYGKRLDTINTVTKLLSLLAILFLGRREESLQPDLQRVMQELAEVDRREAKAAKYFRKRRSR